MTELGPSADPAEETLFDGYPALVQNLGQLLLAIVTLGIALLFFWWQSRGRHYRVTTRRVVVETGILSKRLEQVDLYRVNDYTVLRPFGQRVMGTGTLQLRTMDKSSPEVLLAGIKTDVVALYEKVRVATEADKKRRGVRPLEMD
ncbi:MAG TPA: PH domain-containing protein [Polyangiaceae bacterium]|jgi:uncharacterized membrane protein YdbT with pleckstrin-like domain|nr:PH domain-containing protein [Polyangiaceae bacterium]